MKPNTGPTAGEKTIAVTCHINAKLYLELREAAHDCGQAVESFIRDCAEAFAAQRRATRFGFPQAKYTLTMRPRNVLGLERTLHRKKVYLPGTRKDLTKRERSGSILLAGEEPPKDA